MKEVKAFIHRGRVVDVILDGDLVGVRRTPEARDGQVVVARLEGELTIKCLARGKGGIRHRTRGRLDRGRAVRAARDDLLARQAN